MDGGALFTSSTRLEDVHPDMSSAMSSFASWDFLEQLCIVVFSFSILLVSQACSRRVREEVKGDLQCALEAVLILNLVTWNVWGFVVHLDPIFLQVCRFIQWAVAAPWRPSPLCMVAVWYAVLLSITAPALQGWCDVLNLNGIQRRAFITKHLNAPPPLRGTRGARSRKHRKKRREKKRKSF